MTKALALPVVLLALLVVTLPVAAQQPRDPQDVVKQIQGLGWVHGPADANIGGLATITVPKGLSFLDGPNTRKFLELNLNPPRDDHYTLSSQDLSWFAVFYFESVGYVKDDEKLDPDALLKSLQGSDDRVAEYGLAALVLGGAAAVATKTGFGKALIKFIGIGVVALFGAVAAFFRKFARRTA